MIRPLTLLLAPLFVFAANASAFVPASHDLPVLYLETASGRPVASGETFEPGNLRIDPAPGASDAAYAGAVDVRVHGNFSAHFPKSPFRIKLKTKSGLLGMPSAKSWVLLANYLDKSLLRTELAFELSRRLGLRFTPRSRFVEVYVNRRYFGTYQLTERVEVAKNRLDLRELEATDTDPALVTGGYLLEAARNGRDRVDLTTSRRKVPFKLHSPETPNPEQLAYLANYLDLVEASFAGDFSAYLDAASFVDWYLLSEFSKNNDAIFWGSVYLFKERGEKLSMGPAWDYDLAFGNTTFNHSADPERWWIRTDCPWYDELFKNPRFADLVKARWNALKKTEFLTLVDYVDLQAKRLDLAQANNFAAWPILGTAISGASPYVPKSYADEIDHLKKWIRARYYWMDAEINR